MAYNVINIGNAFDYYSLNLRFKVNRVSRHHGNNRMYQHDHSYHHKQVKDNGSFLASSQTLGTLFCLFWVSHKIQHLFGHNLLLIRACWSSGGTFDCRSRGPLFESCTCLT